jgi:hypothetical protein
MHTSRRSKRIKAINDAALTPRSEEAVNFFALSIVAEDSLKEEIDENHCLLILHNLALAGIENRQVATKNQLDWPSRIEAAASGGFYLECLSLLLHQMDLWLRIFIANKTNESVNKKYPFGRLIECSRGLGLWSHLCDSVSVFNHERIAAIHHYLLGGCAYDELKYVFLASDGLETSVFTSVIAQVAEPFTSLPADDDFLLIQWNGPSPPANVAWSSDIKERIEMAKRGELKRRPRP